jgi:hypothetical protein
MGRGGVRCKQLQNGLKEKRMFWSHSVKNWLWTGYRSDVMLLRGEGCTERCSFFGRGRWQSWRTGLLYVITWQWVRFLCFDRQCDKGNSSEKGYLRRRRCDTGPNMTQPQHEWLFSSLPFENPRGQNPGSAEWLTMYYPSRRSSVFLQRTPPHTSITFPQIMEPNSWSVQTMWRRWKYLLDFVIIVMNETWYLPL